ncbi:MAG: lysophospholipid acyltransferase family protein [Candidatus Bipolaricaulota bacterium]
MNDFSPTKRIRRFQLKKKKLNKLRNLVYRLILLILKPVVKLLFNLRVRGKENIPQNTDRVLITASHTSYWDPPFIGIVFGLGRQVHFIAREGLLNNPIFKYPVRWFSTTINRDNFGKGDLRKMLAAFREEGLLCIFPEGTTSEGAPPKSGTVRLAEKTDRRFLPVKIKIERSPLQYPFFFAPAVLTIGKPFDLQDLKDRADETRKPNSGEASSTDYRRLTTTLMKIVNEL